MESLRDRLRPLAETIEELKAGDESYWKVYFPFVPGADYRFVAYVYEDGDACISARRNGAPDDEGWHSVGGCAALRFSNFRFPKIDGKEKEYRAPAVRASDSAQ